MVAKLPVLKGKTRYRYHDELMDFDPYLSTWSPYHGAVYAVVESVAKIVAAGGDYKKIRLTFQEYFRRMSQKIRRDGASRLQHYSVHTMHRLDFGLPSIGGKDSMSGTFNDIDVPPTLGIFRCGCCK